MFLRKSFTTPTILLDGDLYMYRAASSAEFEKDWGDDIWSLNTDLKQAKEIFINMVDGFKEELECARVVVTFSGYENFRRGVEPTYKANRAKTRKPIGYKALVEWAIEKYDSIRVNTLEADDVMGIMGSIPGTKAIIVSDDKDMKSVPCKLYRPQSKERLDVTIPDADRFFLTQCLTGDTVDGYGGCPKVGPKTAIKLLGTRPSWQAVVAAYNMEGLNEEYALTQARLARILRCTDWDDSTREPILWEPNR